MSVRISAEDFETEVINSENPVLVDFYSDSCLPCKRLSAMLSQLNSRVKIVKINIAYDNNISEQYQVTSVPTLILFKNGKELSRLNGAINQQEIIKIINEEQ